MTEHAGKSATKISEIVLNEGWDLRKREELYWEIRGCKYVEEKFVCRRRYCSEYLRYDIGDQRRTIKPVVAPRGTGTTLAYRTISYDTRYSTAIRFKTNQPHHHPIDGEWEN